METQKTITDWSREHFGYQSPLTIALRMNVEQAELLQALNSLELEERKVDAGPLEDFLAALSERHGRFAHEPDDLDQVYARAVDEVADVGVMLLQVAEVLGVDLMVQVSRKMVKNRARQWAKTADGTFQHVEGT